jgi:hypothetical protein
MSYVHPTTPTVTIRFARTEDTVALAKLAELDSARPLAGPALVAERDGRLLAALALTGGRVVADPFMPTADLVGLLELRAANIRGTRSRRTRAASLSRRAVLAR